jgi:hypothetical protein
VKVAWDRERGIDIDALARATVGSLKRRVAPPRGPQQVNYFLGALVQRMDDDIARYALAPPDDPQYRVLVNGHARSSAAKLCPDGVLRPPR